MYGQNIPLEPKSVQMLSYIIDVSTNGHFYMNIKTNQLSPEWTSLMSMQSLH